MARTARLEAVRGVMAALEGAARHDVAPFGDARIDSALPGGGLPLGRWHHLSGKGIELETAAVSGAIAALMARPLAARGTVVWILRRDDLYAPGLAGLGFPPERLIWVKARTEAEALAAFEDCLAAPGVSAVIGEVEAVDLTAGRRLQLACEARGSTGFLVDRRPFGGRQARAREGSAAATRWTVAAAPSAPPPEELELRGLGPPRWRLDLDRCRGGRTGAWEVEQADGPYPLRVVADLGDRQLETTEPRRLAG